MTSAAPADDPLLANLAELKKNWDGLARHDPMWAVLSDPNKLNKGWDKDEFFATGRAEIADLQGYIQQHLVPLGLQQDTGRALDFGCGLGRLSQGLAQHYAQVDGIDISAEMVAQAREFNAFGERVNYHVNLNNALPFEADTFDLVYSNIVLQHIDKANALKYIAGFVRVLKPGGVVIFSVPSRCLSSSDDVLVSPVKAPAGTFAINMNPIPQAEVLATLQAAGGRLLQLHDYPVAGPEYECIRYAVTK